jgi:phospholipid/cholesterol/gamma-HCH transport system substrate-binding protein
MSKGGRRAAIWKIGVRVALFTVICLVFTFALIAVFGQLRFEDRTGYQAVFTNISGLKSGNFVRIAGVEVGKVGDLTLHRDGTVTVGFAVDKGVRLTDGTKAVVRYENLIGDRYLALEEGPGTPSRLPPGATIPLARTSPALDIDSLIGGFRPLFRALDPDQVNALSGQLLQIFQGQGGTLASVLAQTSVLTSTLAGRGELIAELITNLNTVLHTFATRDHEFSDGLDKLSQLVDGLAQRKDDISTGLAYINAAAGSVADLLVQARQPIKDVVRETDRMSGQVLSDREYVDGLLKQLPDVYQVLARQGLNGDYFGFYFCEVLLKLNGRGGNPIFVKLRGQPSGRCTPQ